MASIYAKYGEYYDLIYSDKNYEIECSNIEDYFNKYCKIKPKSILDVACGTGSHALIFAKKGYKVTGIDISEVMIEQAKKKAEKMHLQVVFQVQDMRKIKLNRKFDAALCLFGSIGYMITDEDLLQALKNIRGHLVDDGIFVFDFWPTTSYVTRQRWYTPRKVVKDDITIIRLMKGEFVISKSLLKLEIECYVIKGDRVIDHFTENHLLRGFTITELSHYLVECGFKPLAFFKVKWGGERVYTFDEVDAGTSNACCIALAA